MKKFFNMFKNKKSLKDETKKPTKHDQEKLNLEVYHAYHKLSNKLILVVDDSSINRYVLVEMIKIIDKEALIDQAENGQEAVEMAKKKKYGLIFMDIIMPVLNGDKASEEIRKFDKEVYICGVTGQIEKSQSYLVSGMDVVLSKPIELQKLRIFFQNIFI